MHRTNTDGRIARALFQIDLKRAGLINTPCLLLGPLYYFNFGAYGDASFEACDLSKLQAFVQLLARLVSVPFWPGAVLKVKR